MDKQLFFVLVIIFLALALAFEAARIIRRLKKIERSKTDLWLGIGLYVSVLGCLASILLPIFASAAIAANRTRSEKRARLLSVGMFMYAADNDDRLPPVADWTDLIEPYTELALDGPYSDYGDVRSFAEGGVIAGNAIGMNRHVGHLSFSEMLDPAQVLLAERTGSGKNLPVDERSEFEGDGRSVAFMDGHAKWRTRKYGGELLWTFPIPSPHDEVDDQGPDPAADQE